LFLSRGCFSGWEGVESNRASASFSIIFALASVSMISALEVDSFEWSHDDCAQFIRCDGSGLGANALTSTKHCETMACNVRRDRIR